jgi:hypothetical protein
LQEGGLTNNYKRYQEDHGKVPAQNQFNTMQTAIE